MQEETRRLGEELETVKSESMVAQGVMDEEVPCTRHPVSGCRRSSTRRTRRWPRRRRG